MNVKTTLVLMLALGSAAAAETVTEKTGVNSALGIAPKTQDFVTEAAVSDMTAKATRTRTAGRHPARQSEAAAQYQPSAASAFGNYFGLGKAR